MQACAYLQQLGFSTSVSDGNLIVTPASRLTDELRQWIRGHKTQLINELVAASRLSRERLIDLADDLGVDARLVDGLTYDELVEGSHESNAALRAYLLALQATADRQAGRIPEGYCYEATCTGCGPVWLFTPGTVEGCPWCWNRVEGLPIPRPLHKTCNT